MLDKIINLVITRGKRIEKVFWLFTLLCLIAFPFVKVNYDLSEYLPQNAPTRQALNVMENEFGYPGMARIMLKNVTPQEAKTMRDRIAAVDGVDIVLGADSLSNVYMGNAFLSNKLSDQFYKNGNAIFELIFDEGDADPKTRNALTQISELIGAQETCSSGSAVASKSRQDSITKEIAIAICVAVVIIWLILTLTTTSWLEPFLFLTVMGVAVILNMGSNIIFGSISFFTFSTAAILQMAVSMDYSIFLLHAFTAHQEMGMEPQKAMACALKEACSSILASGMTTIVGFLAIALMEFSIGKDVGFVLTKGILCSLLTVLLLMPTMILRFQGKIKRAEHRRLVPSFDKLGKAMYKIRWPVLVISLLIAVPCYFGQNMNAFYYGDEALGAGPGTRYYEDSQEINREFGKSNMVMAIIPKDSLVKERELSNALEALPFTNYALSLATTLPNGVPESFLPKDLVAQLHSNNYARILISTNTSEESEYSFACSDTLTQTVKSFYPKDAYVIGMTPTTLDIRDIMTKDYSRVSVLSLIGVAIVVMLTFHSVLVPILVIIPIEVAIYLNMTLPYIMGDSVIFIGYIIVSCLQLGATIDYSILMTNHYLGERLHYDRKESARRAIDKSTLSILTSGSILTVVGYLLFFTSSIRSISQVGHLVGRGAILSMVLVLSLLPALLCALDKPIQRQQQRALARRTRHRIDKKGDPHEV